MTRYKLVTVRKNGGTTYRTNVFDLTRNGVQQDIRKFENTGRIVSVKFSNNEKGYPCLKS